MSSGSAGQAAAGVLAGHVMGTDTAFFGAGTVVICEESVGAGVSKADIVSIGSGFFVGIAGVVSVSEKVCGGEPGIGRV